MHLTIKRRSGLPSLRGAGPLRLWRTLIAQARRRGVRTVAFALMANHIHWVVVPESAEALRDATRYVFGMLARRLGALWERRGKVFVERYYSCIGRSARQAWNQLGYVLRNPASAGCWEPCTDADDDLSRLDWFVGVDIEELTRQRFLRSVFGRDGPALRHLLLQMSAQPVPYASLATRLQVAIPGLG